MTTAADWSGRVGESWAAELARTDRSFADLSPHLDAAIRAAAPDGPGSAVDLGCGAGQTSITFATARPDLTVTGVDLSPDLVRAAAARGAALPNLRFTVADLATEPEVVASGADILFSRHGVMFFADPATVFARLHAAVAPGTPLVFSCFRSAAENPWAGDLIAHITGKAPQPLAGYAPGPFGFADPDWVKTMLAAAGWRAAAAQPVDYRYVAGEGDDPIADAVAFFRRIGPVASAIGAAPEPDRLAMIDRLATALGLHRDGATVGFPAAAWIWTTRA